MTCGTLADFLLIFGVGIFVGALVTVVAYEIRTFF